MAAAARRKPPTVHGPTKPLPQDQLQATLEHFVDVLEKEHSLVFNHHLGVHSGTAVIEDLLARKLWQLCNTAHRMITMKDSCMDTFLQFCEDLSMDKRNRMLTTFLMFDKGDLLDYVELVKPHLVKDSMNKPLTQPPPDSWTPARNKLTVYGESTKPRVQGIPPAPFISRVAALRKYGHPFLEIVDKLIEEKHARPTSVEDAVSEVDSVVLGLRNGVVTDSMAEQVHKMLKMNVTARKKWLAGTPLHVALLESPSPRSPSTRSGRSLLSGTPRTGTGTPRTVTPSTISECQVFQEV